MLQERKQSHSNDFLKKSNNINAPSQNVSLYSLGYFTLLIILRSLFLVKYLHQWITSRRDKGMVHQKQWLRFAASNSVSWGTNCKTEPYLQRNDEIANEDEDSGQTVESWTSTGPGIL